VVVGRAVVVVVGAAVVVVGRAVVVVVGFGLAVVVVVTTTFERAVVVVVGRTAVDVVVVGAAVVVVVGSSLARRNVRACASDRLARIGSACASRSAVAASTERSDAPIPDAPDVSSRTSLGADSRTENSAPMSTTTIKAVSTKAGTWRRPCGG
jgi:hypothetical protein